MNLFSNYVLIEINSYSPNKVIVFLKNHGVNIYHSEISKDKVILKINYLDTKIIEKYYKFSINKYYGFLNIIMQIRYNIFLMIYILAVISIIYIYTFLIVDVQVTTNNKKLEEIVRLDLKKYGIYKYTFFYKINELDIIKNKILKNNNKVLEWLNLEKNGMKFIINIEPKVDKDPEILPEKCNIIARKNGMVNKVITSKGKEVVDVNDTVSKGDILISGTIDYNNEVKGYVCAKGSVYAKTWYTISISVPKSYVLSKKINVNRYNFIFKNKNDSYKLFKDRIKNAEVSSKTIFKLFDYRVVLEKRTLVKKVKKYYRKKDINKLVDKVINKKMKSVLYGDYKILEKKVLKKIENDSRIDIEVFVIALEDIALSSTFTIEE